MKFIFRLLIILILTYLVNLTNIFFLPRKDFKIKNVEVNGISKNLIISVKSALNLLKNKNIILIKEEAIEKNLMKDIRVDEIKIEKQGLNKINITLTEKNPKYYLQYKNEIYLVDKMGNVYSKISESKILNLPLIYIKSKEEIEVLIKIINRIKNIDLINILSQIYIENADCIILVLKDGVKIKTKLDVVTEKYYIAECLFANLFMKKIEYIDIRFEDYVIKYLED